MDEKKIEEVMALVKTHRDDWYEYLSCSDDKTLAMRALYRRSEKAIETKLRQLLGEQHG